MLVISNDGSAETSEFSLTELMFASKRLFRSSLPSHIHLAFDIDMKHAHIHGSPTLINQAIMNLILNARDAVESVKLPSVSVTLKAMRGPANKTPGSLGYIALAVTDNGHGIEKHTRDRMFEPFYSTKPSTKGTGRGLAIVYNVAQICGGYVDVDSTPGEGSSFTLCLPLVDMPAAIHQQRALNDEDSWQADDTGILLVEDNKAVRKVNRDIIESLGYTTFSARHGRAAVKKAHFFKDEIGLIIMDLSMPEMGGLEAALEIRMQGNPVPIIFCSGNTYFFKPIERHAEKLMPFSMLTKPFNVQVLGKKIHDLLHCADPTVCSQSGGSTAA